MMIVTCYLLLLLSFPTSYQTTYILLSGLRVPPNLMHHLPRFFLLTLGVCFLNKHHHLALNIPSIINQPHLLACAR
jgi:hypothetical protein